jgi:hypothetical protein
MLSSALQTILANATGPWEIKTYGKGCVCNAQRSVPMQSSDCAEVCARA